MALCEAEPGDLVGDPETRGDPKSERHDAAKQRVRKVSAKTTTPGAPSGYPFAGPSALCAAAELNVTQSMILNKFMVPNSLSEVDPTRSKLKLKCCPFH